VDSKAWHLNIKKPSALDGLMDRPRAVSRPLLKTFGNQAIFLAASCLLLAALGLAWYVADDPVFFETLRSRIRENLIGTVTAALLMGSMLYLIFLKPRIQALEATADFACRLKTRYGETMPVPGVTAEFERLGKALNHTSLRLRDQEVDIMAKSAELRAENRFVNALLDAAGALVVVLDDLGRIVTFNNACEKATGHRFNEVKGKLIWDVLIPDEDKPVNPPASFSLTVEAKSNRSESTWLAKDGNRRIISWTNNVLSDDKGRVQHLVSVGIDVTEQRTAEQTLKKSQLFLSRAQRMAGLGNWEWDLLNGNFVCSDEIYQIFGFASGNSSLTYETFLEAIHTDDHPVARKAFDECLVDRSPYSFEHRIIRPDGSIRYVHQQGEASFDLNNQPRHLWGSVLDVTDQKNAEVRLKLASKVVENTAEAILITDAKARIIDVNTAFTRMTGYTKEDVLGKNPNVMKSDRQNEAFYENMWSSIKESGWWAGEIWDHRKNGEEFPKWLSISAVNNDKGEVANYVAIFTDISRAKEAEAQLRQLAHYDTLTGLPNRVLFYDRLQNEIDRARRYNRIMAVMFVDLDRFKHVNDTLGHGAGDSLLKSVGERLVECTRKPDTVARLGGDEFTIILTDVPETGYVEAISKRVVAELSKAIPIQANEVFVSASIGIALYPNDGEDSETLMKCADTAMYYAKDKGKNTYQFFNSEMNGLASARLKMEVGLRRALERNELSLCYQPKMDLANGRVVGSEALLRWNNPDIGSVSPSSFIPVAEETGLIIPIGRYVLSEVCKQAKQWADLGMASVPVSVNLSAREFKDQSLVHDIRAILDDTELDPSMLEIEVTETLVMDDLPTSISVMQNLKDMGLHLSVDDFGTGYSSLSYLKRLPVDTLKIDRSFVVDVTDNTDDRAIVSAIISMARNLNLRVVAEGVETRDQLRFLHQEGCHQAQGYIISRPISSDRMGDALRQACRILPANAA